MITDYYEQMKWQGIVLEKLLVGCVYLNVSLVQSKYI